MTNSPPEVDERGLYSVADAMRLLGLKKTSSTMQSNSAQDEEALTPALDATTDGCR